MIQSTHKQKLRKSTLLFLLLLFTVPVWGQTIKLKDSSIKDGDKLASISELTLEFDFAEAATSLGKAENELGLSSSLENYFKYRMLVYRGGKTSEFVGTEQNPETCESIVGYGYQTISKNNVVPGNHSITIPLISTVDLDAGETYCIYIPAKMFRAGITGTTYANTALTEPIIIEITGEQDGSNSIKLISYSPNNEGEITSLNNVTLEFSGDVTVQDNSSAQITVSGAEYAQSTQITSEGSVVTVSFDNVSLYKGKDYIVTIPQGTITSADGSQQMDAISLFYKGGAYNYLTTGRVVPASGSEISWFTSIDIPFTFPEGYNIGNPEGVYLKLYEGSLDTEPESFLCEGNAGSNLSANLWKFDLKPNTTYYAVIDKEQIFPARADDNRIKLKDTTNAEVVLQYTTPAELEAPATIVPVLSTPADLETLERLDEVVLNFAKYEFEDVSYEIKVAIETAIFNDGTSDTPLPLTYDEKTGNVTVNVNRSLEPGRNYTLTIPANTFVPVANESLVAVAGNKEIKLTYTGKTLERYEVECILAGVGAVKTTVTEGETLSFEAVDTPDWKVTGVLLGKTELESENGTYTTPAITEDAVITVSYEYAGKIDYDFSNGVEAPADAPYAVSSEGERLSISGVNPGDVITIYTTGGLMMSRLDKVTEGNDIVNITLPTGNVYIVTINSTVLKIRH